MFQKIIWFYKLTFYSFYRWQIKAWSPNPVMSGVISLSALMFMMFWDIIIFISILLRKWILSGYFNYIPFTLFAIIIFILNYYFCVRIYDFNKIKIQFESNPMLFKKYVRLYIIPLFIISFTFLFVGPIILWSYILE